MCYIIVAVFLNKLEHAPAFYEKMGHLKIPVMIQASSIFRTMSWNFGQWKEILESEYNKLFDSTIKFLKTKELESEILSPENSCMIALLLCGASSHQAQDNIYSIVEPSTNDKIKEIIDLYAKNPE
jgi:hypothetical protein